MYSRNRIVVSRKDVQRLAHANVEYANGFIKRTRNDEITLRVEVNAENIVGMTAQGLNAFARVDIVNADGAVVGSRAEILAVRGP